MLAGAEPEQTGSIDGALARAMLSLDGLSCGDAFGECFFLPLAEARSLITRRVLPAGPWQFTDDTLMAISIVETLRRHGEVVEPRLAEHFAHLYDPTRGYGAAMHSLLLRIGLRGGEVWREESSGLFDGRGSFGNGSAMRVAPLGGYFADDLSRVIEQAERSAMVTHCHPEGVAGAIAVAVGAALAWRLRDLPPDSRSFLEQIASCIPSSEVLNGIERALRLEEAATVHEAAAVLGNGSKVSAPDTVPFVLWCASRFRGDYEEALWQTVSVLGDRDTTCAMVGGIVALGVSLGGIPREWRRRREPLGVLLGR